MPPKRRGASRTRAASTASRGGRRTSRRSPSPSIPPTASASRRVTATHTRGAATTGSSDMAEVNLSTILPLDDSLPSFRASQHARDSHKSRARATAAEAMRDGRGAQSAPSSSAAARQQTVSIHDVDPWLRFNVYIRRGYRPSRLTARQALASVFLYVHNETVNIITHFIPFCMMLYWTFHPPVTPFFWTLMQQLGHHDNERAATTTTAGGTATAASASASASSSLSAGAASGVLSARWARGDVWGDRTDRKGSTGHAASQHGASAGVSGGQHRGNGGGRFTWFLRNPIDETVARATAPLLFSSSAAAGGGYGSDAALATRYFESDPRPILARLSAAFCMTFLLSLTYHVFMPCPHTARGYRQLLQCDVTGVLFSIAGSVYVYFERGNPCSSASLRRSLAILMWVSSIATVYALIIAPVQKELWHTLSLALRAVQYTFAEIVCGVLEGLRGGRPLEAPHPQSANLVWHWLWKGHCRWRRWRRDGRIEVLLRDLDDKGSSDGDEQSESEGEGVGGHRGGLRAHTDAAASAHAPAMTAQQRAAIVLIHCILHFVCFVLLITPKRRDYGYTEAVYYHGMSYVWLIVGGAINALRVPERFVTHLRIKAHAHHLALQERDAQEACLRQLEIESGRARGAGAAAEKSRASAVPRLCEAVVGWLDRFSLPRFITRYVISNRELDYCGNSHNIWHVCTAMSTISMLTGAYYDCVEYELIRCAQ